MEEGGDNKDANGEAAAGKDAAVTGKDAAAETKVSEEDDKPEGEEGDEDENKEESGGDLMNLKGTPITNNNTVVHQVCEKQFFKNPT